jgi:hypothetical protein
LLANRLFPVLFDLPSLKPDVASAVHQQQWQILSMNERNGFLSINRKTHERSKEMAERVPICRNSSILEEMREMEDRIMRPTVRDLY